METGIMKPIKVIIASILLALAPLAGLSAGKSQPQDMAQLESVLNKLDLDKGSYEMLASQATTLYDLLLNEAKTNSGFASALLYTGLDFTYLVMKDPLKRLMHVLLDTCQEFIDQKIPNNPHILALKNEAQPRIKSLKQCIRLATTSTGGAATAAQIDILFATLKPHITAATDHIQGQVKAADITITLSSDHLKLIAALGNHTACTSVATDLTTILRKNMLQSLSSNDMENIIGFFKNEANINKIKRIFGNLETAIKNQINQTTQATIKQKLHALATQARSAFQSITSRIQAEIDAFVQATA